MKKVLLISTGGTISQVHDENGIAISNEDSIKGDAFATILGSAQEQTGVEIVGSKTILNKDSSNIVQEDWQLIVNSIVEDYDNYDAFIITHGTNTLGYTCAATAFALTNVGKPVVFTGAQVSIGIPGSDGVINLENVLRVIDECPELVGVFTVFGSRVITGTRVKKKTEFDYDAFKTFGRIPDIGRIGNSIIINRQALEYHLSFLGDKAKTSDKLVVKNVFDKNIISLTEFPGLQSRFLKSLADDGVKGFIIRGTGAGDLNISKHSNDYENLNDAFEYLMNRGIPVVVTTQAPDGVASMHVNEPGHLALQLNAIPSWDMSIESMTAKLSWLIAQNKSYNEIREEMVQPFKGEIIPY